jgi:hypothetical protein
MLPLLLTTLCCWQAPDPAKPPATPAPAAAKPVPIALAPCDDQAAKAAISEWGKLGKEASMAERAKGLERLAVGANKQLVKPLAFAVETDKSLVIRKRAVELLALQPAVDAGASLRKLLKSDKVQAAPPVFAEVVRGLGKAGYTAAMWPELEPLFDRRYDLELVPMQEAMLELVILHKEKQAVAMLLRNLDEPYPADIDGADNPPKEYWEARWKSWAVWRNKVKDGLFAITGQRFSTAAEAKAWLEKNPLK